MLILFRDQAEKPVIMSRSHSFNYRNHY